jgi:hypothetical protein
MAGYSPQARHGLIALLVSRRVKAERARRARLAEARTAEEARAAEEAGKKARRTGWFR